VAYTSAHYGCTRRNPVFPAYRVQRGIAKAERLRCRRFLTGQRWEDISKFRFSDMSDGRLFIVQEKTSHKLAISLDLELKAAGIVLGV